MGVTTLDLHLTQIFPFYNEGDLVDTVVPFMDAGDHVAIDEPIAQIETDKFVAAEGDTFEPGTKIAVISKSGERVTHVAPSVTTVEPTPSEKKANKQEHTTETPVLKEAPKEKPKAPPPSPSRPRPQKLNFLQRKGKEDYKKIVETIFYFTKCCCVYVCSGSNDKTQERLKDSQNTFVLLTTFNEVDMTNLMKLRSDYKDVLVEKHGVKLGLMSGFVKATVSGLQNQPIINAVIDGDDDIIYRDYIDISIAIGTSKVSHLSK
ncbi:hypothetical protein ACSBR2_029791 [Camellia fascicularis]